MQRWAQSPTRGTEEARPPKGEATLTHNHQEHADANHSLLQGQSPCSHFPDGSLGGHRTAPRLI